MRTTEKDLYYNKVVDWKMEDGLLIRVIWLSWLTQRQRVSAMGSQTIRRSSQST